jgi:hypothetical protein
MPEIDVTITKTVTKHVTLSPQQVERIMEDYARRELGFQNPDVTLDAGMDFLREIRISSREDADDEGGA